jgi:hypothetical protein
VLQFLFYYSAQLSPWHVKFHVETTASDRTICIVRNSFYKVVLLAPGGNATSCIFLQGRGLQLVSVFGSKLRDRNLSTFSQVS